MPLPVPRPLQVTSWFQMEQEEDSEDCPGLRLPAFTWDLQLRPIVFWRCRVISHFTHRAGRSTTQQPGLLLLKTRKGSTLLSFPHFSFLTSPFSPLITFPSFPTLRVFSPLNTPLEPGYWEQRVWTVKRKQRKNPSRYTQLTEKCEMKQARSQIPGRPYILDLLNTWCFHICPSLKASVISLPLLNARK